MFTFLGEEITAALVELNAEFEDPMLAVGRVFIVDDKKELNDTGRMLFIIENMVYLKMLCAKTAAQHAEAQAERATRH